VPTGTFSRSELVYAMSLPLTVLIPLPSNFILYFRWSNNNSCNSDISNIITVILPEHVAELRGKWSLNGSSPNCSGKKVTHLFLNISSQLLAWFFYIFSVSLLPSAFWHCCLGGRKGIRPVKKWGRWRCAMVSPDGVAHSRIVCVSATVNLPLHHEVQKFSSGTGSPG